MWIILICEEDYEKKNVIILVGWKIIRNAKVLTLQYSFNQYMFSFFYHNEAI